MKFLFLIIIPNICLAQINVKAFIKNSKGEALPFTNIVSLKSNFGTITQENGDFLLKNININDSIKISNIAYIPLIIAIKNINNNDTIILRDSIKRLEGVIVKNFNQFKKNEIIGITNNKNNGEFSLIPGNQLSIYINNPNKREAWIKEVNFRIKKFGKCKNSIRIRFIKPDTLTLSPTYDILDENVTIPSNELKKSNNINLSIYKIVLPKEGVFVVLEWIYPQSDCDKNSYTSISANMEIYENLVWLNFRDKKWSNSYNPRHGDGRYMTPNINIKVTY
jgi:hypothetical protein